MDYDEDMHLCMRCGQTVLGLDNYVTHRQQLCYKFQQPCHNVFLPAPPEIQNEPQVSELPSVANDIYKLSAADFFLSLNLQSNPKHSDSSVEETADISKSNECDSDILCSKLNISTIDNALDCPFPDDDDDKTIDCDSVSDLPSLGCNDIVDLNSVIFPGEKWDDYGDDNRDMCNSENSDYTKSNRILPSSFLNDPCAHNSKEYSNDQGVDVNVNCSTSKAKKKKKKPMKEYAYTNFSVLNVPRTSYRQKLCANDSMVCCQSKPTTFSCSFCSKTFYFESTYVDHLLTCKDQQKCDAKQWEAEIFRNERHFVSSSHFKCMLCSFYCNESFAFLTHLKGASHRQNAASLKKPLICIICQDECSSSDEMKEHFSRCHLQYSRMDHPVAIAEKKKNLHCCYCFTILRTAASLDESSSLQEEDRIYMKRGLKSTYLCSYGVNKQNFKLAIAKVSRMLKSSVSPPQVVQVESDQLESKPPEADQENGGSNPEVIVLSDDSNSVEELPSSPTSPAKRILAKITSKNGKFFYKKLKLSQKLWTCKECGTGFCSRLALESHSKDCAESVHRLKMKITLRKRNNNGVTSFLCDKCTYIGKSFNQLTRHFRSHSGEKPFLCNYCNLTFSLSSQLIRHTRLHTGRKPYKCPYCSYACNTQENLRKHILKTKKHEGKAMYPCEHCDYETNEFNCYKDHLLSVHSISFPNGIVQNSVSSNVEESHAL